MATKRSEKGLLTPDNCVVAIIDLQPQMMFGVGNFDRQTIINNNVGLLKATRVFDVPVVLSTVETKSFSGNMWPQIQAIYPDQTPIERSSIEFLGRQELCRRHRKERQEKNCYVRAVD
jgi:nicotinamidase-related amidase